MQRASLMASFLLFLLLCASVAYWLLDWLAPEPRAVAAPPQAERTLPPVTAAASLFGGQPQAGMANVQLRGIIHAGRAESSVAIIAAEDKPVRALRIDSEVLPGLTVKQINARTVVLSERGVERELSLPPFSAQEGGLQVDAQPMSPQQQPVPQPPQVQPQQPMPEQPAAAGGISSQGASASGAGVPSAALPGTRVPDAGTSAGGEAAPARGQPAPPPALAPSAPPAVQLAPAQQPAVRQR